MMVSVVMSSATRVPETSLLLSTLLRQPTTYRGPLLALTITARTIACLFSAEKTLLQLHCQVAGQMLVQIKRKRQSGPCLANTLMLHEGQQKQPQIQACMPQAQSWERTALLVKLPQHLPYNLPNALQRLQVVLRLVILCLGRLHLAQAAARSPCTPTSQVAAAAQLN